MKQNVLLFLFIAVFLACNNPNEFEIEGTITNAEQDKIYLSELSQSAAIVDSSKIDENGKFHFDGITKQPKYYQLRLNPEETIYLIIAPGDDIRLTANPQSFSRTYQVAGSKDSKLIKQLNTQLYTTVDELNQLSKIIKERTGTAGFDTVQQQVQNKYRQILSRHKQDVIRFITENKTSLASLMALYQQLGPRNFTFDIAEDLHYFKMIDSTLSKAYPQSTHVKELHNYITEAEKQLDQQESQGSQIRIGSKAPNIALPSPDGDTIELYSLRGKYVLLDFWAAWCGPCRRENPNLVENYDKYHEKGFEIYQVSLDKNRKAWVDAIQHDNLGWYHVSDLKYWNSEPAKKYNVRGIPANFLLDKNGKIIAINLRGKALGKRLDKIFN